MIWYKKDFFTKFKKKKWQVWEFTESLIMHSFYFELYADIYRLLPMSKTAKKIFSIFFLISCNKSTKHIFDLAKFAFTI